MGGNLDILSLLRAAQGNSSGLTGGTPPPDMAPPAAGAPPAAPSGPMAPPAPPGAPPSGPPPQGGQPQLGPRLTGIKGYLSNIFYNMGEAAKVQAGIPTDAQKQAAALKQQNENLQTQADVFEKQARGKFYESQADMVDTPLGKMPSSIAKAVLPQYVRGQFTLDAAKARVQAQQNQMTFKAAYGPDGQIGLGMYDKQGNFRGMAENGAVPSEYLEKIKQGQEAKFDANGNLYLIGTTSSTKPVIPAAPSTSATPGAPTAAPPTKGGLHPILNNALNGARPVNNAKPVMVNGQPFQGPTAADVGPAYDPKTNQYVITTRSDAGASGYQNFQKSSPAQIENDRQLNNRLTDVQQKIDRYNNSFNQDLSAGDKYVLSKLMSDQHFEAAFKPFGVGVTIPTGFLTELDRAAQANGLSPEGMERINAYFNAREAMSGYQRVLTGSSRGGEKNLQLQLDVLPSPIVSKDFAGNSFNQFRENLKIAGQGLPRMKGVQTASDVDQRFGQGGQQEPPRPANVPAGYVYKVNGPKGTGWYKP